MQIKAEKHIEEEIRRRAQAAADAAGDDITIHEVHVTALREPNEHGSHWYVNAVREPGSGYVAAAVDALQREWDLRV